MNEKQNFIAETENVVEGKPKRNYFFLKTECEGCKKKFKCRFVETSNWLCDICYEKIYKN